MLHANIASGAASLSGRSRKQSEYEKEAPHEKTSAYPFAGTCHVPVPIFVHGSNGRRASTGNYRKSWYHTAK